MVWSLDHEGSQRVFHNLVGPLNESIGLRVVGRHGGSLGSAMVKHLRQQVVIKFNPPIGLDVALRTEEGEIRIENRGGYVTSIFVSEGDGLDESGQLIYHPSLIYIILAT